MKISLEIKMIELSKALGVLALMLSSSLSFAECRTEITRATPADQLVDHGDGTVTDLSTGLMWKQCSEGQDAGNSCGGEAEFFAIGAIHQFGDHMFDDWDELVNGSNSEKLCGYSDWRVPEIQELISLVHYEHDEYGSPPVDHAFFPHTQKHSYWSSTSAYAGEVGSSVARYAATIHFYLGEGVTAPRDTYLVFVRLVRGSQ